MKKRFLSVLLCLCMALSLLPTAALAATNYDGWPSDASTLNEGDTVTIGGVTYTYKGDASTSGIEMYTTDENLDATAYTDACCWKAGGGYVLYLPTVVSGKTTSAEITLQSAEISTTDAKALGLPYHSSGADSYPVPVTVNVEGENHLTTTSASYSALNHGAGDTTFAGGGTLTITGRLYNKDAVIIRSNAKVTLDGSTSSQIVGNLTVTDSGSKLTIADGANLAVGVWGGTPAATVKVENGGVLENNGTLAMAEQVDANNSYIVGEISGSGAFQFSSNSQLYCLVDGVFYPYSGDVSASGLNLSGENNDGTENPAYDAPTEVTRYKAGSGYIIYTPATTNPAANAKLELHDVTINTTSGRALYLPTEAVDITVTGNNSLTANGSYNFAIDPNGQAVSITGNGSLSLTGNKGIASWNGSTPSVSIDIGGNLVISTNQTYSISGNGNIDLSAASITTGIITAGSGSLTATAKTGNLTIDNGTSNSTAVYAGNITLNAPNGAISVAGKGNRLLDTSGMVTLNAKGNIAFTSSDTSSVPINFGTGVSMTSDAGSIDVTTSGYSCIEKTSDGTGGGAVTLSAAKDITLNADNTAILASAEAVNLTAVGKLTASALQGIVAGALTVKANEVDVTSSTMDGINATSVSITNPTGGNCKSVSVTATSSSDSWAAIHALGTAETGNITIKADDVFICGKNSAKAISALGTVTINGAGLIVGAIATGTKSIAAGITCASVSGGDKSGGLNLSTPPSVATYYTADSGYVVFTPSTAEAPATLTLHNATIHNTANINDETGTGIALPDGAVTIAVEGTNTVGAQCTNAISGSNTDVTLSGTGVLNVGDSGIALKSTEANPHSFTKGTGVTLNGIVETYDNSDESGDKNTNTVYGNVTFPSGVSTSLDGSVFVTQGATMTIPQGTTLDLKDAITIANNGTIVNNGTVLLSDGTEAAVIKAMKLTGTGVVKVGSQSYSNGGNALTVISGGLDLSGAGDSGNLTTDGYHWDNAKNTLTIGNVYVSGGLTLPDNATISTTSDSIISGNITGAGGTAMHLTFAGTASLSINGVISLAANNDTLTVQDGAQVTVNGSLSLGAYGLDGILNVTGSGTTLSISSDNSYAVMCGAVNVQNGASLTAHSEGSYGLYVLTNGVSVTGGSTLTVGCDYGVYVKDGCFTIDESSTFTANASIAAVCVVDTTNTKAQSQMLNVPSSMLPSGTKITSAVGDTLGYTYWTIANSASIVTATNEAGDPATIANALGALTLKKASSSIGGGSIGGSTSVSYTLTFVTNGGSAIDKLSKTSGTVIDLSAYKPTREGYDFDGWYSDQALTTQITSVTLTKNTTVYAKWTEQEKQAEQITNPFADVSDSAYYHDAVLWAAEKNITTGTTATTFSPDMTCTRAQMVTFLWRAIGSPEPTSADCSFTDVAQNAYYYKAVLWAVEKGITAGTSATTFGPDDTVTRGQAVTFLWRAAGKPETTSANPFTDVSEDAYYYDAVLWAVEQGVTLGTSSETFDPSGACIRAQIVTLLYRYMAE